MIYLSIFYAFLISSAGSLLASKKSKNIYCGKKCNYPLTTTQGDRFASCENIVSRSQTSSPPPPPLRTNRTFGDCRGRSPALPALRLHLITGSTRTHSWRGLGPIKADFSLISYPDLLLTKPSIRDLGTRLASHLMR